MAKFWLKVLGYDYQGVIQTTPGRYLERRSIITQNSRAEKHAGEVTWKSKGQVYYTITNNLVRNAKQ